MNKGKQERETRSLCTLLAVTALAALLSAGCNEMVTGPQSGGRYYAEALEESPAHGGTTPPNAAAYDAVFFEHYGVNPFIDTEDDNLSTFALDVDTASYTICRYYLRDGYLPPKEAVRVEEFLNYFKYDYPAPTDADFAIHLEAAPSRFGSERYQLLRVGIRGRDIEAASRRAAVLTFVIDVSGSMEGPERLGLVQRSLRLLVDRLREGDRVGIVVYGTNAHVVLPHSGIENRQTILDAIEHLSTEGATNADEGLRFGYRLAAESFDPEAINRVILCSDGVANMGETGAQGILDKIAEHADSGITLSAIGFGMGNYNDVLMEKLADRGDGNYYYVDSLNEARRVLAENLTGMLQLIARDAKVQVQFNADVVSRYRLIGYENRRLADDEFRDDRIDAGEIGAGHQVTALYEIKLHRDAPAAGAAATVRMRWADPESGERVTEIEQTIDCGLFAGSFDSASADFRLAAAVAEAAEILRRSYWAQESSLADVLAVTAGLPEQYRLRADVIELMDLISTAGSIEAAE